MKQSEERTARNGVDLHRLVLDGGVTLYNADCMSVVGEIKADAVVTDPPFGSTACHWDQHLDWPMLWPMLWQSLGEDGVIVLHSAQPFTHPLIASQLQHHKYSWIWQKNLATNFFHAKRQPLRAHEEINVFYRKVGRYFPQMSDGHTPTQSARGKSKGVLWHGENVRDEDGGKTTRYPQTLLNFPVVDPKCRIHPSEKPVDLLEYLVRTYTREGETVLDFSMGSGSTAIACLRSGRKFVGIERDTEIFNLAKKRIASWQKMYPQKRCRWINSDGIPCWIPGCMGGAAVGPSGCTCKTQNERNKNGRKR